MWNLRSHMLGPGGHKTEEENCTLSLIFKEWKRVIRKDCASEILAKLSIPTF